MKVRTLRGRVTLWSAGFVTGALLLFGAGAAWNLRRELLENLDAQIRTEADAFRGELAEQPVDWSSRENVEAFLSENPSRFPYLEILSAAQRADYRSPLLHDQPIIGAPGDTHTVKLSWNGQRLRIGTFTQDGLTFALGQDLAGVDETLAGLARSYVFTLPLVILAVGAGSWLIAQRAVAPMKSIAARAENISASDLHQRLPEPPLPNEIGQLTHVLNAMFDRLQRSFEQVTRFTSDASHELKTPLARMRAQLETTLNGGHIGPTQRELLANLIEQCSQLSQIVDGLLFLSRADDRRLVMEQSAVDLVALAHELREDAEILSAEARLALEWDLPQELPVRGDIRLLRRARMNLIDNAIKYNRREGTITITASSRDGNALLSVRNTGPGIPATVRDEIFQRFHRGELAHGEGSGGHGLGLSIAREIARAHGGDVTLVSAAPEQTEFCLVIPTVPKDSEIFSERGRQSAHLSNR